MPTPSITIEISAEDCLVGMAKLLAGSVDVVVTSPPYNMGIAYASYQDRLSPEDYLNWCVCWLAEIKRVIKDNGSLFLNVGSSATAPLLAHEMVFGASGVGFELSRIPFIGSRRFPSSSTMERFFRGGISSRSTRGII